MSSKKAEYLVVHPIHDVPEQKRTGEGLGRIRMSASVRWSLIVLRGYLILMLLLTLYRTLQLAGVFRP